MQRRKCSSRQCGSRECGGRQRNSPAAAHGTWGAPLCVKLEQGLVTCTGHGHGDLGTGAGALALPYGLSPEAPGHPPSPPEAGGTVTTKAPLRPACLLKTVMAFQSRRSSHLEETF